jgi:hypothetical protein
MMHIARELCGGRICVTPDGASFVNPEIGGGPVPRRPAGGGYPGVFLACRPA